MTNLVRRAILHAMPDELMTTFEVAKHYGKSVGTINRWVREERIKPGVKAPGKRGANLFAASDLPPLSELEGVAYLPSPDGEPVPGFNGLRGKRIGGAA